MTILNRKRMNLFNIIAAIIVFPTNLATGGVNTFHHHLQQRNILTDVGYRQIILSLNVISFESQSSIWSFTVITGPTSS